MALIKACQRLGGGLFAWQMAIKAKGERKRELRVVTITEGDVIRGNNTAAWV